MSKPNSLTVEQRAELVLSVIKGVEPLEALARRHGVSANTLRKWRDDFLEAGKARLNGGDSQSTLRQEVTQLRKDLSEREMIIGELTVANRFLEKKARPGDGTR